MRSCGRQVHSDPVIVKVSSSGNTGSCRKVDDALWLDAFVGEHARSQKVGLAAVLRLVLRPSGRSTRTQVWWRCERGARLSTGREDSKRSTRGRRREARHSQSSVDKFLRLRTAGVAVLG